MANVHQELIRDMMRETYGDSKPHSNVPSSMRGTGVKGLPPGGGAIKGLPPYGAGIRGLPAGGAGLGVGGVRQKQFHIMEPLLKNGSDFGKDVVTDLKKELMDKISYI